MANTPNLNLENVNVLLDTDYAYNQLVSEIIAKINNNNLKIDELPNNFISSSQKGVVNGVATLGSDGIIPKTQLPTDSGSVERVTDITARDAITNLYDNKLVFVIDATGDTTVTAGWAMYIYSIASLSWTKIVDGESLDIQLTWDNIANKPITFPPDVHNHEQITINTNNITDLQNNKVDKVLDSRLVSETEIAVFNDKYSKVEVDNKLSALETNIDWKESVATFADIATTYPTPADGWTVNTKDTDYTYRYNGNSWVVISANAIPKATTLVDGLMSKEYVAQVDTNKTDILSAKTTLGSVAMTTTAQTVTSAINELDADIGDKSTLITTDKTNLVNAVNETKEQINTLATVGLDYTDDTGSPRGVNAVDLQHVRTSSDQVAGVDSSFIAGGQRNKISNIITRDTNAYCSHVEGLNNKAYEWFNHVEGTNCIVDGKISHAEGNTVICTANDSHAEGNRTVAGRKYFSGITTGSEDAGDNLGILEYILIPNVEGNVTSWFPNALTDNITTRYGVGSQKDIKGNIYAEGNTPAIWTGNIPTIPNDLRWAMHPVCILRGASEKEIEFANIAKAIYIAEVGTKVYYYGMKPFTSLIGIYSSYAPQVNVNGLLCGNGIHAEGIFTSAVGYGAHAEGFITRAWGYASHSEGRETQAINDYAHAEGLYSEARGFCSRAIGQDAVATRDYQNAYAIGKITKKGDCQLTEIDYKHSTFNVGWWIIYILKGCEVGKAYNFETMVFGRQTGGIAEVVGNTFAYKFTGCFIRNNDGTFTVLGTPTRTLIGRSAGMSGDGLTTGVRISWSSLFTNNDAHLRMDGLADTTFVVTTHNIIQEIGL